MDKNNLRILTIIATYNGSRWIRKCIDSIQSSNIVTDIFAIDNASNDDTVLVLKSYPNIILHENKDNLGFGQANNIGMRYALENNYDYVFLLNQDAWVENDTLNALMSISISNKDYGILSPLHYYSDQKSLEYNFSVQLSPWFCKDIMSDYVTKNQKEMKAIYPLNFVNAAAWLIPKKTLEIVGGFDPLFFQYGEDNNYCHRVKYHGFKIGVVPSTKIYHDCLDVNNNKRQNIEDQLSKFELETKTSFANINTDVNKIKIVGLAFKKFILCLVFVFRLKITDARFHFLAFRAVFKNCNRIIESRNKNFISRPNYLSN
jgi:GT2 family glycosyltransferase